VETWVNGAGTAGSTGDGGAALSATLHYPEGLLIHPGGGLLLVAEQLGHVIRAVHLQTRVITRWAGTGTAGSSGDGLDKLAAAALDKPHSMVVLPDNSILVSSFAGCRLVRITADGVVRQFAGTGTCSTTGDGGDALSATLNGPVQLTLHNTSTGTMVYWGEYMGHRVRA
jgi:hypothetical protein